MTDQPQKVGLEHRLLATGYDRDNFPRMDSERWLPVGLAREAAAEIARLRAELSVVMEEKEKQVNYWGDRCCKAEAQRDKLLAALNLTMIGGNHLANVLIGRLGGGFAAKYPPDLDHEVALQMLGATDTYDVWCCWAAIMTARTAIAAVEDRRD